jgi:poly-beta-1,6-N-acetyl-D-glucosamine N-deacetylase
MEGKEQHDFPEKHLLSWAQVRELKLSGLVEIASHSYDLHNSITANPRGNTGAAAVTRKYNPETARYESDSQYRTRINHALAQSSDFIFQLTGFRPRVMVWPYGEYNKITVDAARLAGMPITMALGDGDNHLTNLSVLHRLMLYGNPDAKSFANMLKQTTRR